MEKFEIVCVDDDKDVLEIILDTVESAGHKPIGFCQAEEAVGYIEKNKHKIIMILSDLRMDDVNGFEFKKLLGKTVKDIPFVIITGYWTVEMSSEAMSLGIDAFLEKPIKADVLNEQIEKFGQARLELLQEEREMIEGFLEESSPMLDEIESLILELEESADKEQPLSVYFRLLHTIKGTASCVGLTKLGDYTHKYEDFIGEMRNQVIDVNTGSINVLLAGLDDLKKFFSMVEEQGADRELEVENHIDKFLNFDANSTSSSEPVAKADTKVEKKQSSSPASNVKAEDDKMTVSMGLLNEFMEESGELTVIRNSILKTVKKIEGRYRGDDDIEQLNELLNGMYSVTSTIQGKITEMRKVPLKNTFRPYKRLVRDLTKKLSKEVELEIEGEELLVDNVLAKLFSNTMIHVIRNSLDHGIETPEVRTGNGKSSHGTLTIAAYEEGEDIVLKVKDDGKGIDPHIIKKLAVKKGLYTDEELNALSDLQIVNIIFESGFSTAEQVSDLSGRGVGMDMVRGSFEEMGGQVFVQSELNIGSTFTMRVPKPKSVLIINTLSVSCGGNIALFHMDEVVEVLRYEHENRTTKVFKIDDKEVLDHNGEMIDVVHLRDVIGMDKSKNEQVMNVVILRVAGRKYGVVVDEIFEFEEVVLRKISDQIQSKSIYHGASLIGAGEVAMILSSEGIAKQCQLEIIQDTNDALADLIKDQMLERFNEYMLFKTSGGEVLAIDLDQVERLEKVNLSKIEHVGNNQVIRYNESVLHLIDPAFSLALSDSCELERKWQMQSEAMDVIVVQVEGRRLGFCVHELEEIKNTDQEINTDTIDMPGLTGSLYLNGKTVCVIDVEHLIHLVERKKSIQESMSFNIPKAA